MPIKAPKLCRTCKQQTSNRNGYCDEHAKESVNWNKYKSSWQGKGSTRKQRKEREAVLRRDKGLCQPCLQRGIYQVANEVDHIINMAAGGGDVMSNKQAICRQCHQQKTAKESQAGLTRGVGKN